MILKHTTLTPLDKCGVWEVKSFHLYGGSHVRATSSGRFIKVSVKKTKPNNWVSKSSKLRAIILYTKRELRKSDGTVFRFKYNSVVLLKKRLTPKGKEIVGPALYNIKRKKFINSFIGII